MNDIYQGSFSSIGYSNFIIIIIENFNNHFSNLKIFVYAIIKKKISLFLLLYVNLLIKKLLVFFMEIQCIGLFILIFVLYSL